LRVEELWARSDRPPRCGIDARAGENLPYGAGAESVAESGELAVDAPMPQWEFSTSKDSRQRGARSMRRHRRGWRAAGACARGGRAAAEGVGATAESRRVMRTPRQRRVWSSRASTAQRSSRAVAGVCVAATRSVGGAGRGSRSRWRCRSGRGAPSSSAASRTSGRSASRHQRIMPWQVRRRSGSSVTIAGPRAPRGLGLLIG